MPNERVAYFITMPFPVKIPSDKLEPSFPGRWRGLSCEQEKEPEVKGFFIQVLSRRPIPKADFSEDAQSHSKISVKWAKE